jgi:outer membrane protein TolC
VGRQKITRVESMRNFRIELRNELAFPLLVLAMWLIASVSQIAGGQATASSGWLLSDDPDSAISRTLATFHGTYISLDEARSLALKNANGIRTAEAGLQVAEGRHRSSKSPFDPVFSTGISTSNIEQPVSSPFTGSEYRQTSIETAVTWQLPTGTQLGAQLQTSKSRTNGPFSTLEPQYSASATFSIVQPLLQGFGRSASAELTASRQDMDAAEASLKDARMATLAFVESLYWELYAAERDYAVKILDRDEAELLLRETELRAEAGVVNSGQVASARVFLAQQKLEVLDSRENVERASDALSEMIGAYPKPAGTRYRAMNSPPSTIRLSNLDSLVDLAQVNNQTLQSCENLLAAAESRLSGALWDRLPTLNLVGSLGGNGLTGSPRTVVFANDTLQSNINGNWSDAYESALGRDYPTWVIGLELRMPLFRHGDRGEYYRSRGEVELAKNSLNAARREIERAVRENYREVEQSETRLDAARAGVEAAQEQVRIGYIEYRAGRTTAFELVRLVADHASAHQRYSTAVARAAQAAANLRWLTASAAADESNQ